MASLSFTFSLAAQDMCIVEHLLCFQIFTFINNDGTNMLVHVYLKHLYLLKHGDIIIHLY